MEKGEDFIVERELPTLVARMNALAGGEPLLELEPGRARDRAPATGSSTIRSARTCRSRPFARRARLSRRQADPHGQAASSCSIPARAR